MKQVESLAAAAWCLGLIIGCESMSPKCGWMTAGNAVEKAAR